MSLPIVLVSLGAFIFALVPQLPDVNPRQHLTLTEHAAELGVLISLLGTGLAIDRRPGWRSWATTWRLLGIAMPLTIAVITLIGWGFVGLPPSAALLLGAAIAPTDPVLAADVQVGEPAVDGQPTDREDQVRFTLTSEAGLNDGLAFPFVFAAIAIAANDGAPSDWIAGWLLSDLVIRLSIGIVAGWLAGKVLSRLIFNPPRPFTALAETTEGFVAIGAILLTYGLTELAHGYGFLAVFIAAVTLRSHQREHTYHKTLHHFSGQVEQLLSVGLLVLLGGAIADGLLADISWRSAIAAFVVIFVVRPVAGRLALIRSDTDPAERRAIAFFGIRGIGSIYYVAYASGHADFPRIGEVWAAVALTILLSVLIHGVTATPVMRQLDRRRRRHERRTVAA